MKIAVSDDLRHIGKVVVAVRRQACVAAVLAVTLGLTGCASAPGGQGTASPAPVAREESVRQRVEARWDALIRGDVKAAYGYLSPASRAVTSFERYQSRIGRSFREIKIDSITCETETCRVRLWLTFDHQVMKGIVTPIEETWVFDGGQAWFVYRE